MWKREAFASRTIGLFLGGLVINAFLLLAIASVLSSLIIMRILRPIMWVAEGVKQLGSGNLSYRILEDRKRKSGRFRHLIKSFDDMTDRMGRMLEARERLLLDVSHELRTPLTRMKVALELLPQSREADSIREDVLEMEKMISQILETARKRDDHTQLKCVRTDIANLIVEIKDFYKKQSVEIKVELTPGSLMLDIDPEKVKSVFRNVIDNAIKYSDDDAKPIEVTMRLGTEHVIVRVKDSGIGILPEELPLVFEPFYRVDKSRSKRSGGYGLGLNLCRNIMEAHKGRIKIESVMGEGTTVSLFFPR